MLTSRSLTASKISLLLLVKLYCVSDFPLSAVVPILSFILSHHYPTSPSAARHPRAAKQHDIPLSIQAFQDVLQSHASNMPGRTLLDDVLKHMWQMDSVDSLFCLFDSLENLLVPTKGGQSEDGTSRPIQLAPTSPLGAFVRRARLEFARFPFDDIVHLWRSFVAYRAPSASWTKGLPESSTLHVDHVAAEMGVEHDDTLSHITYGRFLDFKNAPVPLSVDDLERVLEFQLDRLQRMHQRSKPVTVVNEL